MFNGKNLTRKWEYINYTTITCTIDRFLIPLSFLWFLHFVSFLIYVMCNYTYIYVLTVFFFPFILQFRISICTFFLSASTSNACNGKESICVCNDLSDESMQPMKWMFVCPNDDVWYDSAQMDMKFIRSLFLIFDWVVEHFYWQNVMYFIV